MALTFIGLAVIHTWPLASDLPHISRVDNADTELNAWAVSWVAHRLPRDPLHLFDANIFFPDRHTLAYSEPLIPPALLGAPMRWAGASPVTTYNVLVLVGLVATAFGMYVLVFRLTGDPLAGVLAGCLLAFNSHTLTRLPHLQALHVQWLPLSLWALDRLFGGGGRRDALWLGLFCVLAALTSGYLAVFVAVTLVVAILARADRWVQRDRLQLLSHLALAGVVALIGSGVGLWPYAVVDQGGPLRRSIEDVVMHSATLQDYLTTAGRFHYEIWSHRFYEAGRDALFPGITGLVLGVMALGVRKKGRAHTRVIVAVGLVGLLLSLGPATPLYGWLSAVFPPLRSIRAASRFGYLFLFAVAALAGLGAANLRKRGDLGVGMRVVVIACIVLVNLEALRAPMSFVQFDGFSPLYRTIAETSDVEALAEFPLWPPGSIARNGRYVLASTEHWKPLLNGYSGFVPSSYADASNRLSGFPAPESIEILREIGISHIVVHPALYDPARAAQVLAEIANQSDLKFLAVDEKGSRLYRVRAQNGT